MSNKLKLFALFFTLTLATPQVSYGSESEFEDETDQQFLNGKLVYRPNPNSDEEMIELPISDFQNIFEGKFDLSECGTAGTFFTITTDPGVFFKVAVKQTTVNILIALYPFIQKHLTNMTEPFGKIMQDWDNGIAPVGIFWRWGSESDLSRYDYLISSSLEEISCNNLYENWGSDKTSHQIQNVMRPWMKRTERFHIDFMTQNEDY
jgi:hypothetical protein